MSLLLFSPKCFQSIKIQSSVSKRLNQAFRFTFFTHSQSKPFTQLFISPAINLIVEAALLLMFSLHCC